MRSDILYQDSLVEISNDAIILKNYYFPSLKPKKIRLTSVQKIEIKNPSLRAGKWRIHGTGDFRTWFPLDWARNTRDRIFIITTLNKWGRVGFTVEDADAVDNILRGKELLV